MKFMSRDDYEMGIEIYEDRPRSGRPAEIVSEELKNVFCNTCRQDVIM